MNSAVLIAIAVHKIDMECHVAQDSQEIFNGFRTSEMIFHRHFSNSPHRLGIFQNIPLPPSQSNFNKSTNPSFAIRQIASEMAVTFTSPAGDGIQRVKTVSPGNSKTAFPSLNPTAS